MSIDKMDIFYYIIIIKQEDKKMILKNLQMSLLKSFRCSDWDFWSGLFVFGCITWIMSLIINITLYTRDEYLFLSLCFSGMLLISLLSFIGILYVNDDVVNYDNYKEYEKLPPKGKKSLFLFTCYYCIFICSTPLVVIFLPLFIIKIIFYDFPSMILDKVFAEKPVKENVLKNYEQLLK